MNYEEQLRVSIRGVRVFRQASAALDEPRKRFRKYKSRHALAALETFYELYGDESGVIRLLAIQAANASRGGRGAQRRFALSESEESAHYL